LKGERRDFSGGGIQGAEKRAGHLGRAGQQNSKGNASEKRQKGEKKIP